MYKGAESDKPRVVSGNDRAVKEFYFFNNDPGVRPDVFMPLATAGPQQALS